MLVLQTGAAWVPALPLHNRLVDYNQAKQSANTAREQFILTGGIPAVICAPVEQTPPRGSTA